MLHLLALAALAQTPEDLDKLRLDKPVRVEAALVEGSKLTAEQMKPALDSFVAEQREFLKTKTQLTDEQIDRQISTLRSFYQRFATPKKMDVVFTADATKFVLQRDMADQKPDPIEGDNPTRLVFVYDGKWSYTIVGNGHQIILAAGMDYVPVDLIPLPGVGIGPFPLVKGLTADQKEKVKSTPPEGYVLCNPATPRRHAKDDNAFGYYLGTIKAKTVDGMWQVEQTTQGMPERARDIWNFSDPFTFEGHRIARSFSHGEYLSDADHKVMKDPIRCMDFKIKKITVGAAAKDFDFKTYVAEKDVIVSYQKTGIVFRYDPSLTMDQMVEKHKNDPKGVINDGG